MAKTPIADDFILTQQDAVKTLHVFGHFGDVPLSEVEGIEPNHSDFSDAIERLQDDRGLTIDSHLGGITARNMMLPTCGTNEQARGECAWNGGCGNSSDYTEITIHFNPKGVRGISETVAMDMAIVSAKSWSDASGINWKWVDDPDEANVRAYMSRLGSSILGLAQLPCGTPCNDQLWLRMQITSQWEGGEAGSFREVFTHEMGHSNGHDHQDRKPSVMTSRALGVYPRPTDYDIEQSRRRYGPDKMKPPILPPPIDPTDPNPPVPGQLAYILGTAFDSNGKKIGAVNQRFDYSDILPPEL